MKIFDNAFFDKNNRGCVLAFGNFDGVHVGHNHLLSAAKDYAKENNLEFGIYTFVDSPKFSGANHSILTTLQTRLSLFEHAVSPDFVYLENFDNVKNMKPIEFVEYIVSKFGCECGFCGENFKFGKNAEGTSSVLFELLNSFEKKAVIVPSLELDNGVVSSSRIRTLIREGYVHKASELLGDYYGFVSKVIHGAHLGNKLGFPTINQLIPDELICPKYGVYATLVTVGDNEYMGVTNFGVKPTVSSGASPVAETYIIDFDGDVYDKQVGVYFVERLRDEKTFSSLDELRLNISLNVEQTRELFKENYEKE